MASDSPVSENDFDSNHIRPSATQGQVDSSNNSDPSGESSSEELNPSVDIFQSCEQSTQSISISQSSNGTTITWPAQGYTHFDYRLKNSVHEVVLIGESDTNSLTWMPTHHGWHHLEIGVNSTPFIAHTFWTKSPLSDVETTISQHGHNTCVQWHLDADQNFELEISALKDPDVVWTRSSRSSSIHILTIDLGAYRLRYTNESGDTNELFFMRQFDYQTDRSGSTIEPSSNQPAGWINFVVDSYLEDSFYRIFVRNTLGKEVFAVETASPSSKHFLPPGQYQWSVIPVRQNSFGKVEGRRSQWRSFSVVENTDLPNDDRNLQLVQNTLRGIFLDTHERPNSAANLYFEIERPPQHGTLWGTGTKNLSYQPDPGFIGEDSATYRIYDGDRASLAATINFDVTSPKNPNRSHFVPGIGTINYDGGTPGPPTHSGSPLPSPIAVVSGLAKVIDAIDTDGSTLWRYQKDDTWDAIAVCNDVLIFDDANTIYWIDSRSGHLLHTEGLEHRLFFANPTAQGLLIGERMNNEEHTIAMFQPKSGILWRLPQRFNFPRWADINGERVVVADTFNSKIIGIDIQQRKTIFSQDVYFANDIRFLNPETLLVVEEHADRVWTYDLKQKRRKWILGASNGLENVDLDIDQLIALTHTMRINPDDDTSYSKSWRGYAGIQTLYAPNGAIAAPGGGYYIADTDNHRVVYATEQGKIVSEITGFNNPNKISLLSSNEQLPDEVCHPERTSN